MVLKQYNFLSVKNMVVIIKQCLVVKKYDNTNTYLLDC